MENIPRSCENKEGLSMWRDSPCCTSSWNQRSRELSSFDKIKEIMSSVNIMAGTKSRFALKLVVSFRVIGMNLIACLPDCEVRSRRGHICRVKRLVSLLHSRQIRKLPAILNILLSIPCPVEYMKDFNSTYLAKGNRNDIVLNIPTQDFTDDIIVPHFFLNHKITRILSYLTNSFKQTWSHSPPRTTCVGT